MIPITTSENIDTTNFNPYVIPHKRPYVVPPKRTEADQKISDIINCILYKTR